MNEEMEEEVAQAAAAAAQAEPPAERAAQYLEKKRALAQSQSSPDLGSSAAQRRSVQQLLQEAVRRRRKEEAKKPAVRRRVPRTTPVLFEDSPQGTLQLFEQSNEELLAALLYEESLDGESCAAAAVPCAGLADGALENQAFVALMEHVEKVAAEDQWRVAQLPPTPETPQSSAQAEEGKEETVVTTSAESPEKLALVESGFE